MRCSVIFGAPRSGTTYLNSVLSALRSVETTIGQLVPVSLFHIINQDISENIRRALATGLKRNIDVYLSGKYNSRFRALKDWWNAPLQVHRLTDVVRRGPRPWPDLFVYKEPFLTLCP